MIFGRSAEKMNGNHDGFCFGPVLATKLIVRCTAMTLDHHALRTILNEATSIAREASALLMEGWRAAPRVRSKEARRDLVTDYDLASENLIRGGLSRAFPDHLVIGEEQGGVSGELVWYVDPIDGTTNFAHGHPFFCLAMGLCERGEPVAGIVIAPGMGIEWSGGPGLGVSRNGLPCQVSECDDLADALVGTGIPHAGHPRFDSRSRTFFSVDIASHGVRRCGAAAMELALVADGGYDAFWDYGLKPWDVAAGVALIVGAGGRASDFDESPLRVDAERVLVSNGRIHSALSQRICQGERAESR